MRDLRRIGGLAVCLLVLLRMSIGWQFLYEGLWKLDTQDTAQPWTSAGYLKNAKGPFRDHFREMAGDPDDLGLLDYDRVAAEWKDWRDRFVAHYGLDERQTGRLDQLLNGPQEFVVELAELPSSVQLEKVNAKAIRYDRDKRRLVVDGTLHMIPKERDQMLAMAPADEAPKFHQAVRSLYDRSAKLAFVERLAVLLKGDPDRAGQISEAHAGTVDHRRIGDIEKYKLLLERYEANLKQVATAFQYEHLKRQWSEIQGLRASLVGPVKSLAEEFRSEARKLLTESQLAQGPLPEPLVGVRRIDYLTMGALVGLGALLLCGLFSRLAPLGGAVLLTSFYLAMPPWPSVPGFQELPGPEHSFVIDKNLIEVIALLAIAAMPTGRWFGLDALLSGLWSRNRTADGSASPSPTTTRGKRTAALTK